MTEAALELRGLHKRFGALHVLRGVALAAHPGEVIAILGASGSGKSTMLRCCNLLEVPDEGDVLVGGEAFAFRGAGARRHPADRAQVDRLREKLGFVFQNFNLWSHLTVLQNVIEAPVHVQRRPRAEAVAEAEALLAKVGILDKRDHYPAHLSGGQQQRAAIARALVTNPVILMADEPTGNLDSTTGRSILKLFERLHEQGMTLIMVTHDDSIAKRCERVVRLKDGLVEYDRMVENRVRD